MPSSVVSDTDTPVESWCNQIHLWLQIEVEDSNEMLGKVLITGVIALWLLCVPLMGSAMAQTAEANPVNSGDTAWMLVSSALVLLMTPGLAFFYGGLVRSRNVLNTMMMSLILIAVIGVTWVLWGYSLAFEVSTLKDGFAQGSEKFFGNINWMFLNNVAFDKPDPIGYAPTIPHQVFMVYQMMFAIITPALISGAIVERMSF